MINQKRGAVDLSCVRSAAPENAVRCTSVDAKRLRQLSAQRVNNPGELTFAVPEVQVFYSHPTFQRREFDAYVRLIARA